MPINLTNAANNEATTTVEFGGEKAEIVFKPNAITPAMVATLGTGDNSLIKILSTIIVDWEVFKTNGTGKSKKQVKVEPSFEAMQTLPTTFLRQVLRAILRHDEGDGESGEVLPEAGSFVG